MRAGRSRGAKRAARADRGDGAGLTRARCPSTRSLRSTAGQARRDGEPVRAARSAAGCDRLGPRRAPINRYPDGMRGAVKRPCRRPRAARRVGLMLGNGSDELIQILTAGGRRAAVRSCLAPEPVVRHVPAQRARCACALRRRAASRGFHARRGRDAGGDRAGTPGARVARLSEQPDRQPVRRRRRRAHRPRCAGHRRDRRGVRRVRRRFVPAARARFPNLVVVRTVSKIGLAGLRLGYAVAHPDWIDEFDKIRPPYNVNSLTQAACRCCWNMPMLRPTGGGDPRRTRAASSRRCAALPGVRRSRRRPISCWRACPMPGPGSRRCATREFSSRTSTAGIRCSRIACGSPSARPRRTTRWSRRSVENTR